MGDRLALLCRVLNRWKERPCDLCRSRRWVCLVYRYRQWRTE